MTKKILTICAIITALAAGQAARSAPVETSYSAGGPFQQSRVVIVSDPNATAAFDPQPGVIRNMVDRGIRRFAEKPTAAQAWSSLIAPEDVVGIKVFSSPGGRSGTRPAVVAAVVEGLIEAGVSSDRIIIWDKQLHHLRLAGYTELAARYNTRIASSATAGFDEETFYENALIGNLVWGDVEFGRSGDNIGRNSYLTKLLTREITKIISVTPMLNHNLAGVTGNLLSLSLGSVENTIRFEQASDRLAIAVPEIFALEEIADRVVLNIVDALICQYQGEQRTLLHYSVALNELRFSADPVALDVLSIEELERQRQLREVPSGKPRLDLYRNAALLELGAGDPRQIQVERAH